MNPFDFVRQIQSGKQDLMTDPQSEKEYVPFVVNKALSYELDCLAYANEMNQRHHLDRKLQFHYLLNIVRNRKRPFHKWSKPEANEELQSIKLLFECSDRKAAEILHTLTTEQMALVKQATELGGRESKKR